MTREETRAWSARRPTRPGVVGLRKETRRPSDLVMDGGGEIMFMGRERTRRSQARMSLLAKLGKLLGLSSSKPSNE